MTMRLLSFAVWALVSASAVFWLSRLMSQGAPAPAHAVMAGQAVVGASADLSRVLGSTRTSAPAAAAPAAEPTVSARFKLIGVVASRSTQPDSGLALIAVDGKPPKPIGLGGVVDGPLVLLAVNHRRAEIGPSGGEATVTLELPLAPEPNRSTRPPTSLAPPAARPAVAMPVPGVPVQPAPPPAAPVLATPAQPPTPGAAPRTNPAQTR
jgi:general secretion pathway protein C